MRHARGFAEGRQQPKQGMNRLYSVESNLTATGATADHRKRLRASDVEAFLSALANAVGASGKAVAIPGIDARWIAAVAKDLKANGGKSLILGGPHLSPAAHAAILVLNSHLGNIGRTLTLHDPEYGSQASTKDFGELVTAMAAGEVETLVILGGNRFTMRQPTSTSPRLSRKSALRFISVVTLTRPGRRRPGMSRRHIFLRHGATSGRRAGRSASCSR